MNTTPPSSEPAAAAPLPVSVAVATPEQSVVGPSPGLARRYPQRWLDAALNWPGGRWPVPTVTSLFALSALIVAGVELLPKALSDVTSTVHARTEVLELTLEPGRTYVWWLPGGSYSLLTARDGAHCEQRSRFDIACVSTEPTAVTIKNGAVARFELTTAEGATAPSFMLALTPRAVADGAKGKASEFEIRSGADDLLAATSDLVTFESRPVESWRIPLMVERVEIGESLSDGVIAADALGTTARQPIMTEGDVRMFARALWFDERYQIKEERFDPADVVQIPADAATEGRLVGLLSLDAAQRDFDVTLHTELAEVFVRRLGGGHRIGVSMWAIVSKLPFWLALWVVWVSLIVVANYYSDRLGELRGHKNEG
jgi:hypothetical protein